MPGHWASASASGGSGSYAYQWQHRSPGGSWSNISGATGTTYSPGDLTATKEYRRRVIDNNGCGTIYSNTITVTIFAPLVAGSISGGSGTICENDDSGTMTLSGTTGGDPANTIRQWQFRTETGNWSDLAGANGPSFNQAMIETGYFRVKVSSCGEVEYSNTIVITIDNHDCENYITTYQYQQSGATGVETAKELVTISTTYFDGLGRQKQAVVKQNSPLGYDMVQIIKYDDIGRVAKEYLPYTEGINGHIKPNAESQQISFYQTQPDIDHDVAFAEKIFEPSPLNRVLEQGAPGAAWQPDKVTPANGKTIKFGYYVNKTIDVVKILDINVSGQLIWSANYDEDQLIKNVTTDEEGHVVEEYIDKRGRTILKKVESDNAAYPWAQTYYVYDDFGDLRYVLPPEAVKEMGNPTLPHNLSATLLANWAFQYEYDSRHRMIKKKVPGADTVYMVYDARDRLVLTQDGNQRLKHEWIFTKYGVLNRPVATGIYTDLVNTTLKTMQDSVNTYYSNLTNEQAWYESRGAVVHGYDNKSFPQLTDADTYLTLTYYDDYSFPHAANYSFVPALGHTLPFDKVKGRITGTKTKVLDGTSTWLESVTYYDARYRVIQAQTENLFNTIDIVSNRYDFVGKVLETATRHADQTILRSFDYDHAGRLTSIWHELIDNGVSHGRKLLAHNEYNELGELIEKNLHSEDNGTSFAQSVDYRYNIRGWLTSINNAQLDGTAANNVDAGQPTDYWGMELGYNDALSGIAATPTFNGNISAVKWSDDLGASQRGYAYTYDPMNRLEGADHQVLGIANAAPFDMSIGDGVTSGYDLNGNIMALTRKDKTGTDLDALTYTYAGNQLLHVTDAGNESEGFRDGTNPGDDYQYDNNGNMTEDLNKEITSITYNHLNLPDKVEKDASNYILYTYDATGIKLRQQVYEGGTLSKTTDYIGEFIYETPGTGPREIELIQHEEGRIVPDPTTGDMDYEYHLKDHLGNTRVTFTTNPKTIDFTLNYENNPAIPDDIALFENTEDLTISGNDLFDHTDAAGTAYTRSQRLTGAEGARVGSVLALPVGTGDRISAEVFVKYYDPAGNSSNAISTTLAASIIAAFTGGTGVTNELGNQSISNNFGNGSLIGTVGFDPENASAPMAFLNLMFLPEGELITLEKDVSFAYDQLDFGAVQPQTSTKAPHDRMAIDNFEAPGNGYILVYLSNEDATYTEVYFDDLSITVNEHPVVQRDDYYPFGLTHGNGFQRVTTPENSYLFNGKERIPDLDLNWDDFGARMYMPDIGRWGIIDPLSEIQEGFSPYHFVYGNPIRFNDPTGMIGELGQQGIQSTFIDPDGNIIDVRDDGDRSIYLVHDPDNWDGSKGGLAVVGATPEPATLKNFVGQNLYSERVAGYMFQEAERLEYEAWLQAWNRTKAMGELLKSRDEQLRIIEQIKSLNREQMITLLRILKAKELLQHVEKGKGDILNWIGIRTLLNILASQSKNINLPGDTAGDFIMPDDKIYEKALEHRELEKQIIERYDKMINDIQNRN